MGLWELEEGIIIAGQSKMSSAKVKFFKETTWNKKLICREY